MGTWLIWASAVAIKATTFDRWTLYVVYIAGPTPPSSENQAFKHSSSFQLDRSLSALLFHLRSYFHFGLKQLCTANHCLCFASICTASWRTTWRKNGNDFSSIVNFTKIARHLFCLFILAITMRCSDDWIFLFFSCCCALLCESRAKQIFAVKFTSNAFTNDFSNA